MSEYDLIPEEAYENLPQEANDKFAVLVRIAQTNVARLLDQSGSNDFSDEIRSQFISIISGIAEALGIEGLPAMAISRTTASIPCSRFISRVLSQGCACKETLLPSRIRLSLAGLRKRRCSSR